MSREENGTEGTILSQVPDRAGLDRAERAGQGWGNEQGWGPGRAGQGGGGRACSYIKRA